MDLPDTTKTMFCAPLLHGVLHPNLAHLIRFTVLIGFVSILLTTSVTAGEEFPTEIVDFVPADKNPVFTARGE